MTTATYRFHQGEPHIRVTFPLGWFVAASLLLHLLLLWSVTQGRDPIPTSAVQEGMTGLAVHLLQGSPPSPPTSTPLPSQPKGLAATPKTAMLSPTKAAPAEVTVQPSPAATPPKEQLQTVASTTPPTVASDHENTALQEQLKVTLQQALASHFSYPLLARRRGWQGEVLLAFRLEADGRIMDARVARSSGYGVLDHAALSALGKVGRIQPLISQGFAMQLPVIYRLQEG
jgi:protein TonB